MIDENTIDVAETEAAETAEIPMQEVLRPHPQLLTAIVTTALNAAENNPRDEVEALYLASREYIRGQRDSIDTADFTPSIFSYFIEAHRTMMVYKNKQLAEPLDLNHNALYNVAALAVFDLYLSRPEDATVRKMLKMAASALHQVAVSYHSVTTDIVMKEAIGNLSTIALLAQSLSTYIKGSRRSKNYGYISWLKGFFKDTILDPDLSFMKDDAKLKSVVTQVTHSAKVITLT